MLPFTSYVHGSSSFENISTTWSSQNALLHGILGAGGGGGCSLPMEMMMTEPGGGSSSIKSSTTTTTTTSGAAETKALAASKSHSEAERRRRERINGHLATLRTLLPNTTKTDKASLLAEVVQHVKELKKKLEAEVEVKDDEEQDQEEGIYSRDQWWPFPRETDELTIGYCHDQTVYDESSLSSSSSSSSVMLIKVSLSCDDRPDLVSDLTEALRSVRAKVVKAEMATVGGRTKSVLVVQSGGSVNGEKNFRSSASEDFELVKLRKALKSVVERKSGSSGGIVMSTTSTGSGGSSANAAATGNKRPRISNHHLLQQHRLVMK